MGFKTAGGHLFSLSRYICWKKLAWQLAWSKRETYKRKYVSGRRAKLSPRCDRSRGVLWAEVPLKGLPQTLSCLGQNLQGRLCDGVILSGFSAYRCAWPGSLLEPISIRGRRGPITRHWNATGSLELPLPKTLPNKWWLFFFSPHPTSQQRPFQAAALTLGP